MKFISIILINIVLMCVSLAQSGSVSGTVKHKGEPVEFVNIYLKGADKGTITDRSGKFEIKNVSVGEYILRVSYVGFKTYEKVIQVSSEAINFIEVELQTSTTYGEEIVVTGTMRKTYIKDSPVKVNLIKSEQLQQGKTSSNIMDLISSVNGLSTQLNCGVCGTNAIRINGVEGPNTAVLIDGMPVMGALASVYGLNGISPSIIDQVEVIKGPQSTLYGTQALGGVVNIITKNPETTPRFSADIYTKNTQENNINVAYSPRSERFEGFISGNIVRLENYVDDNGDNFNDLVRQTRLALFGKGAFLGKNGERRLNVAAKVYSENRTGGLESFSDDQRGSDQVYGESIYTNRIEFLADYLPTGFNEQLRINGALTYHDQDSYYGTDWYDAQQGIAFGQITWDQSLGNKIQLLSGTSLRYETYNDNTPATGNGVDRRFIPGIFSQAEFKTESLNILVGLRFDHHTEHGLVTAPRLSVKFSPGTLTTFRASAGTGFRVVNVFTEDHAALTGSREVVFTEDLNPEQSRSISVSVEHIIQFEVNPMTISLDGFYTHFSNQIIPDYDQNSDQIIYENLNGYSVTRGVSLDIQQSFISFPFSYNANFTFLDVYSEESGQRQSLAYAPEYLGSFGATYDIKSIDLSLGYNGNLTGSKRMPDSYVEDFGREPESPAYSTHDLKVTKEFSDVNSSNGVGFEVFASVENIFDYKQGSPLVDAANPFGPDFDTIYTWGPIIGRTFSLGARINLR